MYIYICIYLYLYKIIIRSALLCYKELKMLGNKEMMILQSTWPRMQKARMYGVTKKDKIRNEYVTRII